MDKQQTMSEVLQSPAAVQENSQQIIEQSQIATQETVEYAGFWARFAAVLIDGLVLAIPSAILQGIFGKGSGQLLGYILGWAYAVYMLSNQQATLGKMAVGLKVTTIDGGKITIGKAALREIVGKFLDILTLGIGYLMMAFTEKKQGLHDKLADTVVVYDPARKRRNWLVVTGIVIALMIPIMGIVAGTVLVAARNARNKAADQTNQHYIKANWAWAAMYAEQNNNSLFGFEFSSDSRKIYYNCGEEPLVNVSPDGQKIAIFVKSCSNPNNYFCTNYNIAKDAEYKKRIENNMGDIDLYNKDISFAKSGKFECQ